MWKDEKNSALKVYKEGHLGSTPILNDEWGEKKKQTSSNLH